MTCCSLHVHARRAKRRPHLAKAAVRDVVKRARLDDQESAAPGGSLVLLAEQDRDRWNHRQIADAAVALAEAERHCVFGTYQLQAQMARAHVVAASAADVDWRTIAGLYE